MMIRWQGHCEKGVTDGRTDGRTDRQTDGQKCSKSCLVAAKKVGIRRTAQHQIRATMSAAELKITKTDMGKLFCEINLFPPFPPPQIHAILPDSCPPLHPTHPTPKSLSNPLSHHNPVPSLPFILTHLTSPQSSSPLPSCHSVPSLTALHPDVPIPPHSPPPKINTTPHRWLINIGWDNGLVPPGNKPLAEPMLTQIYVVIWCPQSTMS